MKNVSQKKKLLRDKIKNVYVKREEERSKRAK